jgi:copper chaperone CopZ
VKQTTLQIDGMSCGHCVTAVNDALGRLPGVALESVRIGRADLSYDDQVVDLQRIIATLEETGYRATAGDRA